MATHDDLLNVLRRPSPTELMILFRDEMMLTVKHNADDMNAEILNAMRDTISKLSVTCHYSKLEIINILERELCTSKVASDRISSVKQSLSCLL